MGLVIAGKARRGCRNLGERRSDGGMVIATRRSQRHAGASSFDQPQAEFVLQCSQMATDHGVVEAELRGGATNVEMPADRVEDLKRLESRQPHRGA